MTSDTYFLPHKNSTMVFLIQNVEKRTNIKAESKKRGSCAAYRVSLSLINFISVVLVIGSSEAFHSPVVISSLTTIPARITLTSNSNSVRYSSTTPQVEPSFSSSSSCMGGVSDFEEWWDKETKNTSVLKHASFNSGKLRGLSFKKEQDKVFGKSCCFISNDYVLSSSAGTAETKSLDWDTSLAVQLLNECALGKQSKIYGYCSLLLGENFDNDDDNSKTDRLNPTNPTALHAIRHWTSSQKEILLKGGGSSGEKLIQLHETQIQKWNQKYDGLPGEFSVKYSRESFLWALEAVHSRAFRGNFGLSPSSSNGKIQIALGLGIQIISAALGIKQILEGTPQTEISLIACEVAFLLPLLYFLLNSNADTQQQQKENEADSVLLPMIDSANHIQEANSMIEYDPLRNGFDLTLANDNNCYNQESKQVFISYGVKSDTELLLNYGFLPNVMEGVEGETQDEYRMRLANEFIKRNK